MTIELVVKYTLHIKPNFILIYIFKQFRFSSIYQFHRASILQLFTVQSVR